MDTWKISKAPGQQQVRNLLGSEHPLGKAHQEEMKTREGNEIDSQLPQVRVQLPREAEAASDTGHHS